MCALSQTGVGYGQPVAPKDWPQVALIESKGVVASDKDITATGMPVPDPRQGKFDVLHYTLDLQIHPYLPGISGSVLVVSVAGDEPVDQMVLDFLDNMNCTSVDLVYPNATKNLAFEHADDLIVADLPVPMLPGDFSLVEVFFNGVPAPDGLFGYQVSVTAGGSPIVATVSEPWSARSWWPCKDDPRDKASVRTNIMMLDGFTAVSNGILEYKSGRQWTWFERLPISTYLVSLAITEYVEIHDQYDGPAGPIDLRHYVFAEDEAAAREDLSILPEMLDFCGELFGPYPFVDQPFGIAECVWDEAMEHPTAVTYGNVLITGTHQFDTVLMHELAHMWFGDMITPVDWTHVWLNEGFATYAEALWAEHVYGPTGLRNFMASHDWGHGYGVDTLIRNPASSYPPYYFRTIAYHKGAWVLHMLRRWLGDDTFFAALSLYLNDPALRFGNAHSLDFQRACETASSRDLAWFFDQWLYRTTYPMLKLDWRNNWQEGANEFRVRLRQEQDAEPDGSRPAYQIPVELRLIGTGLDSTITIVTHRLDQEFMIPLGATVTRVIVDPDRWLLHDMVSDPAKAGRNVALAPVSLKPAYPNPFNPRTLLRWEAGTTTRDRIEVFDVQGRRILSEDLGEQPAGPREYLWLGTDNAGRQYPSGTYLYRITCRGHTADGDFSRQLQGKVTLTR